MKKIILLAFALICLMVHSANSQNYIIQVKPVDSKFWKYADIAGNIIIDSYYPVSYQFSEDGLAAVYQPKRNLYLLINKKGQVINTQIVGFFLKDAFGYGAKGYSDGLVCVRLDKLWGCLDTAGRIAVPLKYDNLSEFNNGYGIGVVNNKYYVVDQIGKEILIEEEGIIDVKHFEENLAPFASKEDSKGYIDTNGKIAIQPQFTEVGYFSNGLAWAESSQGLTGYINNKGEWVILPKFSAAKNFDKISGLAYVKYNGKWCYTNEKGEILSVSNSDTMDDFFDGLAKGRVNDLVGFYNNKGEWAIPPQFEGARDFKNGFAAVKANGLWGIIDKEGNWVIKPVFAGIRDVVKIK